MVTLYTELTDEELELMAEKAEEEQQEAIHNLVVKRKKLLETGLPEDDEEIKGLDELIGNI